MGLLARVRDAFRGSAEDKLAPTQAEEREADRRSELIEEVHEREIQRGEPVAGALDIPPDPRNLP